MKNNRYHLKSIIVIGVLACSLSAAQARTWKDATGKFSIDAEFVSLKDGRITLKSPTGKEAMLPLSKLCAEDQAYARAQSESGSPEQRMLSSTAEARLSKVTSTINGVRAENHQLDVKIDLTGAAAASAYSIGAVTVKPTMIGGKSLEPMEQFGSDDYQLIDRKAEGVFAEHPKGGVRIKALFQDVPASTKQIAKIEGTVNVLTGGEEKSIVLANLLDYPKGPIKDPAVVAAGLKISFDRMPEGSDVSFNLDFTGERQSFAGIELVGGDGKVLENTSSGWMSTGSQLTRSISAPKEALKKNVTLVIYLRSGAREVELPFVVTAIDVKGN
jgi:hypothetical protein